MKKIYGQVNVIVETPLGRLLTFTMKASAMYDIEDNGDWDAFLDNKIDLEYEYYEDVQLEESLDMYLEDLLEDYTHDDLLVYMHEESFSPDA